MPPLFPPAIAPLAAGVGDYYGNGADGDVIIGAPTSLARDFYYNNLTLNGFSLSPQGHRIFVRNLLHGIGAVTISRNGNNGVDGTGAGTSPAGGAALALGSIATLGGSGGGAGGAQGGGVGSAGGTSVNAPIGLTAGSAAANSNGGIGQGGGGGNNSVGTLAGVGGLVTLAGNTVGNSMYQLFEATSWRSLGTPGGTTTNWQFTGATGGGGGGGSNLAGRGAGGGGGGASYPIFLAYRRLQAGASLGVQALGGYGGNADQDANDLGGGGGGGSGNLIVIVCGDGSVLTAENAPQSVVPGSKVAGAPGIAGPGGGSPGGVGGTGLTLRFQVV